MQVNDIEQSEEDRRKHQENHIWREKAIVLRWNAHDYPAPYYNIPYAIPYLNWFTNASRTMNKNQTKSPTHKD